MEDFAISEPMGGDEYVRVAIRARPLIIWGGGGENREKKFRRLFSRKKKEASARNSRPIFSPAPQIINGRALET